MNWNCGVNATVETRLTCRSGCGGDNLAMVDLSGCVGKCGLFLRRPSKTAYCRADDAKQYLVLFASNLARRKLCKKTFNTVRGYFCGGRMGKFL